MPHKTTRPGVEDMIETPEQWEELRKDKHRLWSMGSGELHNIIDHFSDVILILQAGHERSDQSIIDECSKVMHETACCIQYEKDGGDAFGRLRALRHDLFRLSKQLSLAKLPGTAIGNLKVKEIE